MISISDVVNDEEEMEVFDIDQESNSQFFLNSEFFACHGATSFQESIKISPAVSSSNINNYFLFGSLL